MSTLELRDLEVAYGGVPAVRGLSLTVAPGEIVGLIGPNGAGKSTTLKMLTGILMPTSGAAVVAGLNPHRARKALARKIGVVFDARMRPQPSGHVARTPSTVMSSRPFACSFSESATSGQTT